MLETNEYICLVRVFVNLKHTFMLCCLCCACVFFVFLDLIHILLCVVFCLCICKFDIFVCVVCVSVYL